MINNVDYKTYCLHVLLTKPSNLLLRGEGTLKRSLIEHNFSVSLSKGTLKRRQVAQQTEIDFVFNHLRTLGACHNRSKNDRLKDAAQPRNKIAIKSYFKNELSMVALAFYLFLGLFVFFFFLVFFSEK